MNALLMAWSKFFLFLNLGNIKKYFLKFSAEYIQPFRQNCGCA